MAAMAAPARPADAQVAIDHAQSWLGFEVYTRFGQRVAGEFPRFRGEVEALPDGRHRVRLRVATTEAVIPDRPRYTAWMRGASFFDSGRHPSMEFVSDPFPARLLRAGGPMGIVLASPVRTDTGASVAGFLTISYRLAPLMLANDDQSLFSVALRDPRNASDNLVSDAEGNVTPTPLQSDVDNPPLVRVVSFGARDWTLIYYAKTNAATRAQELAGIVTLIGVAKHQPIESVQAALSVVRSRSQSLGIDPDFHQKWDIHVHVPEGATPKDGPSAGVAMATAIVSVMTGIAVRHDVAMTGEITLRGRVTAIGGLKEKLLAALRGGIRTVIIPEENRKDLADIPVNVTRDLQIVPVKYIEEVLDLALERPLAPKKVRKSAQRVTVRNKAKPAGSARVKH